MGVRKSLMVFCTASCVAVPGFVPAASEEACNQKKVRNIFGQFVEAYNSGAEETLNRMFPPQEDFGMYRAFPEREGPSARDRSTLMTYFEQRHDKGDLFRVESLTTSSEQSPDGSCGISFVLKRKSEDVLPFGDGTFSGKGGIRPRKRHVWAINMSWGP